MPKSDFVYFFHSQCGINLAWVASHSHDLKNLSTEYHNSRNNHFTFAIASTKSSFTSKNTHVLLSGIKTTSLWRVKRTSL